MITIAAGLSISFSSFANVQEQKGSFKNSSGAVKGELVVKERADIKTLSNVDNIETTKSVVLQVNLGNDKIEKYQLKELKESQTVWGIMQTLRLQGLNFQSKSYQGLGEMITEIAGIPNGQNGRYWFLYVNSKKSPVGASSYQLNPGDVIEWRFE